MPSAVGLVDPSMIESLLSQDAGQLRALTSDDQFRAQVRQGCEALGRAAYAPGNRAELTCLHDTLAAIYRQDFGVVPPDRADVETQPVLREVAAILESSMLAAETGPGRVGPGIADHPREGRQYVHWLKRMIAVHPAADHPFYRDFLATRATKDDVRFYLTQESTLDPRFDDILALMQVGAGLSEKMEMAANYWDEMGNGLLANVHTRLFAEALASLSVDDEFVRRNLMLEAKMSGNLSACLALSRRHFYKAVGFFGVTEYLVPRRFKHFLAGCRRLGLAEDVGRYHLLHIGVDARHAAGWFKNVVAPLVDSDPATGTEIALGAVIRLNSSNRYLDALLERTRTA